MGDKIKKSGNQQAVAEKVVEATEVSVRTQLQRAMTTIVKGVPGWSKLNETEQRRVFTQIQDASGDIITSIIGKLASDGRRMVEVQVEKVSIEKNLKITMTTSKTDDNLSDMGHAVGLKGYFVPYIASNHMAPDPEGLKADPDQPALPVEALVVPVQDLVRINDNGSVLLLFKDKLTTLDDVDDSDEDGLIGDLAEFFGLESSAETEEIEEAIHAKFDSGEFVPADKRPVQEDVAETPAVEVTETDAA